MSDFGKFDGVFRFVTLYLVPDYLAQGWTVVFVTPGYSAMMKAPLP